MRRDLAVGAFGLILLAIGHGMGLFVAPAEAMMGDVGRILYVHVPTARVCLVMYTVAFGAAIVALIKGTKGADAWIEASVEVGLLLNVMLLIQGSIWARPTWGIWWTWDARLTSTLVLWLIYVSYLVLRQFGTGGQTPVLASALAIFGFLDVPLVYMSIRWFRTQHPQPVIGGGEGSGIHPAMREALMWNFVAFLVFAVLIVFLRYRLEVAEREVESIHAERALTPAEARRNA